MWYQRYYQQTIDDNLKPGKVFVLYGLRRSGKTSLIQKFLSSYSGRYFMGTGEDMTLAEIFQSQSVQRIKSSFESYNLVVIDEAQYISEIGMGLKLLVDHLPDVKVLASGSSSFDLSNKLGEPLTGRQRIGVLYPISMLEIKDQFGPMEIIQRLEEFMISGTFPEDIMPITISGELTIAKRSILLKSTAESSGDMNSSGARNNPAHPKIG